MINKLLNRLDKVKQKRHNEWVACCPSHNDKNPSLAIKYDESTGKIIMKCWAGCDINDICTAIGIEVSDLFPDAPGDKTGSPGDKKRMYFSGETALASLVSEAAIVRMAAMSINSLDNDDIERVKLAHDRINEAMHHTQQKYNLKK